MLMLVYTFKVFCNSSSIRITYIRNSV